MGSKHTSWGSLRPYSASHRVDRCCLDPQTNRFAVQHTAFHVLYVDMSSIPLLISNYITETAPAMEAVEYIEQDFSDAFNSTSKYRGPPTQELEDAWENLTFSRQDFLTLHVH
jgi:hypothetical protein